MEKRIAWSHLYASISWNGGHYRQVHSNTYEYVPLSSWLRYLYCNKEKFCLHDIPIIQWIEGIGSYSKSIYKKLKFQLNDVHLFYKSKIKKEASPMHPRGSRLLHSRWRRLQWVKALFYVNSSTATCPLLKDPIDIIVYRKKYLLIQYFLFIKKKLYLLSFSVALLIVCVLFCEWELFHLWMPM